MNLDDYQREALTTAVYPLERELDYTVLGLLSEVGELAEVYYDAETCVLPGSSRGWSVDFLNEAMSEVGDCYWYTAAIADALGTTLGQVSEQGQAPKEDLPWTRGHVLVALVREAGAIAGVTKKSIRDDGGYLKAGKADQITTHLARVLALLDRFCELIGTTQHSAMNKNLNKLSDRKSRGTLKGSGNNR